MASADTGLDFGRVVSVLVPDDRRAAIAQRLEEHPAIERVAVASRPPLTGELRTIRLVPSRSGSHSRSKKRRDTWLASPGYFPLLQNRRDPRAAVHRRSKPRAQAAVVIVSRATAQRFWPGADPIGQTLEMRLAGDVIAEGQLPQGRWTSSAWSRTSSRARCFTGSRPRSCISRPPSGAAAASLLARGREDVAATTNAIHAAIEDAYPHAAVEVRPIRDLAALQLWAIGSFSDGGGDPRSRRAPVGVYRHLRCRRIRGRAAAPRIWRTCGARRDDVRSHVRGMVGDALRTGVIGAGAGALLAFAGVTRRLVGLEFDPAVRPALRT